MVFNINLILIISFFSLYLPIFCCENWDQTLQKLKIKYNVPGVAVGIIEKGDEPLWYCLGYADIKNKKAVGPQTIFQMGSISKTATAWGIFELIENNVIDIDAFLFSYIPIHKFDNKNITIRSLLMHRAGISGQSYGGRHPNKMPKNRDLIFLENNPEIDKLRVKSSDNRFCYSGGGYGLLQVVIEKLSEMPFHHYMERAIFEPLKMYHSGFIRKKSSINDYAVGYNFWHRSYPWYEYDVQAAAGMYSTLEDLTRWMQSHSSKLKKEVLQITSPYGLGYQIENSEAGIPVFFHLGTNRGWNALIAWLPTSDDSLIILTNCDTGIHFVLDIFNIWFQSKQYRDLALFQDASTKSDFVKCMAWILAIADFLFLLKIALLLLKNKIKLKINLLSCIFYSIAILWWLLFYTPWIYPEGWMIGAYMPWGFHGLTVWLTVGCLLIALRTSMKLKIITY